MRLVRCERKFPRDDGVLETGGNINESKLPVLPVLFVACCIESHFISSRSGTGYRRLVPVVNFWPHRQDQPSKNLIIVHWSNRSQRFLAVGM